MDRVFMHIAALGIISIALGALIVCALQPKETALVTALVAIISNCSGALGGVMAAPKLYSKLPDKKERNNAEIISPVSDADHP